MKSTSYFYYRSIAIILFTLCSQFLLSQEICDNGIDDDGDFLIDLNDTTDCSCNETINKSVETPTFLNGDFEESNWCPETISQIGALADWVWGMNVTTDYHRTECSFPSLPGFGIPPVFGPDNGDGLVGMFCTTNWAEGV